MDKVNCDSCQENLSHRWTSPRQPINGINHDSKGRLDLEALEEEEENEDLSKSLLSPRKGGTSKKMPGNSKRKVQWSDRIGNQLVEILEFDPSDTSDTDDDDIDSCICTIM